MSGLEAIGALASVCQLIAYSANIIVRLKEFYGSQEGLWKRRDVQIDKVKQLLRIAHIVQTAKPLHTELIDSHIRCINQTAHDIIEVLELDKERPAKMWQKVRRAVQLNNTEQQIERGLAALEESKSSLALCILSSHGAVVLDIHTSVTQGIPQLQADMASIDAKLDGYPEALSEIRETAQAIAETMRRLGGNKAGLRLESILDERGDVQLFDGTILSQGELSGEFNHPPESTCSQGSSDSWCMVPSNKECCAEPHSPCLTSSTIHSLDDELNDGDCKSFEQQTPCTWTPGKPSQMVLREARGTQSLEILSRNDQGEVNEQSCGEGAITIPSETELDCGEMPQMDHTHISETCANNYVSGSAFQVNGSLGGYEPTFPTSITRRVVGNRAMGNSIQLNGDVLDPAFLQVLFSARIR